MSRVIINDIMSTSIGILNQKLLKTFGIFLFLDILLTQKSFKLPLGQRLPQNHLPLKILVTISVAKTRSRKYPSIGNHSPTMDTISTRIPR